MRAIARLERAEPADARPAPHAAWGLRGRVRLLGSICLIAALAVTVYAYWLSPGGAQEVRSKEKRPSADRIRRQVGAATPMETLQLWENLLRGPMIDPRQEPTARLEKQRQATQRRLLAIAVAAGSVGLLMFGVSFFVPPRTIAPRGPAKYDPT